jgi:hypothetical protein
MHNTIYYVAGCKGGVGKTLVALALTNYMCEKYAKVDAIETDTVNSEIKRIFVAHPDPKVNVIQIELDTKDGWATFFQFLSEKSTSVPVIINTPARNKQGVVDNIDFITRAFDSLQRKFVVLWVINRQRDSVVLLKDFMDLFPHSAFHVLRNTFFGAAEKFVTFNDSITRTLVEGKGGKVVNFPELADRVAEEIYSKYYSIKHGISVMKFSNRIELEGWTSNCRKIFDEIILA